MMRKIGLALILLFWSTPVFADVPGILRNYICWGDFDNVVLTFERVALMMSDVRYQGLFFGIIVLAIVFGVVKILGQGLTQGQITPWSWIKLGVTVIAGVAIYITFIRPTDPILVYDEALNQQKTVAGVPEGIVFLAGLTNLIEQGLVDIIWTSGSPDSYRENPGGGVFKVLMEVFQGKFDLSGLGPNGRYFTRSVEKYIEDCLLFEINRRGTRLDVNNFNMTTDFLPLFAEAVNPSIYTIYYDQANKSGATMTCENAWGAISSEFSSNWTPGSGLVDAFWRERCSRAGYRPVFAAIGPDIYDICQQKTSDFLENSIFGVGITPSQIACQYFLASALYSMTKEGDLAFTTRKVGESKLGMSYMANEWIPSIKGVLFAIFMGLTPFLCLLIPTPFFGRAIAFIVGIFVFMLSWGVCDAIIHSYAMDKAIALFNEIADGRLGIKSVMLFQDDSAKALAIFGSARVFAMMIAAVLSGTLVKFGGSAMAHLASQMGPGHAGSAEGAVHNVMDPAQRADAMTAYHQKPMPADAIANAYSYDELARMATMDQMAAAKRSHKNLERFGGGDPITAAETMANSRHFEEAAQIQGHRDFIQKEGGIDNAIGQKAHANVHAMDQHVASAEEHDQIANQFGVTPEKLHHLNAEHNIGKNSQNAVRMSNEANRHGTSMTNLLGAPAKKAAIQTGQTYQTMNSPGGQTLFRTQAQAEVWSKNLRSFMQTASGEIAQHGGMLEMTKDLSQDIANNPEAKLYLGSAGHVDRVLNPDEARNFANYIGRPELADELAGSTAKMNFWVDDEGQLQTSTLFTRKGQLITSDNYQRDRFVLTDAQAEEIVGPGAKGGQYTRVSTVGGENVVWIDAQGGMSYQTSNLATERTVENGQVVTRMSDPATGEVVRTRAEQGISTDVYDDAVRYSEGLRTDYSPAENRLYKKFYNDLSAGGMDPQAAELNAMAGVASHRGSIRDGKEYGSLLQNPGSLLSVGGFQILDIVDRDTDTVKTAGKGFWNNFQTDIYEPAKNVADGISLNLGTAIERIKIGFKTDNADK